MLADELFVKGSRIILAPAKFVNDMSVYIIQNNILHCKIVIQKINILDCVFKCQQERYFGPCCHRTLNLEIIRHTEFIIQCSWNETYDYIFVDWF